MKKDALMVLSGGMDSVTMLYEYADSIDLAVNFTYGSNHNARELEFARLHCHKLGIELVEIDLGFIGELFYSSLLEGPQAVPEGSYDFDSMKSTVVPFRNGIMLAAAAGLAESRGLTAVMIANHAGDHALYPDCREGFVKAMAQAIAEGTYEHTQLRAPYTLLTKAQIAMRGKELGIDYSETYSCYKGGEKHCGRCGTCIERREALALAGIEDKTQYEDLANPDMAETKKGITVYCASSDNIDKTYFGAAYALGKLIAEHGLPVINGGGKMGLMAAVTDGALDAGGEAIGVIPEFMVEAGRNYDRLTQTIITEDMASRKHKLAELAIGVIALPGGVGTLEELTEMMTKRKLGLYDGEVVILNTNHYYDHLIEMLRISQEQGFTYGTASWHVADTPTEAVDIILKRQSE